MTDNLNNKKKDPLSAPGRKPHKSNGFFRNKIFLMYFVPIISVISIIAVVLIIKMVTGKDGVLPASAAGDNVYVLPINERTADKAAVDKDPFTSGGTAALVLDGIIYNPEGTSIVIVRSAEVSYVVSAGGNIGETGWTAVSVTADTVTIEKDGKQEILSLAADETAGLIKN